MPKLAWMIAYARTALRSGFDFSNRSAAEEASASFDQWDHERGEEPMLAPAEAFREDAVEWRLAW